MGPTTAIVDSTQRPGGSPCDEREMDVLVLRYGPLFYRSAFRSLGNAADAEDAVQDAMLSAYKHMSQFRRQARISTWLTPIVINSARMQLRRRLRQPHISLDEQFAERVSSSLCERLSDGEPNP